jgi:hypothetical protein
MPGMPRSNKKGKAIAFSILGVPANMQKQKTSKKKDAVENRLIYEDTTRIK